MAPLIIVVGPTSSGKSALGLEIARKCNGEIICADSRTVYRGMDIGTAKPSEKDQALVPHHLLDVVSPDEDFNVSQFKQEANRLINDIASRGKLPVMVGGTGLYVDSVLFDYGFEGGARAKDAQNPRHLEKTDEPLKRSPLRGNTLVLGLQVAVEELEQRITNRVELMLKKGLETEARTLSKQYGWTKAMSGVGYQEWQAYFNGSQTLEETKELIVIHTRQYAKRQRTWFKRNQDIQWFQDAASALACAENWLIENKSKGQDSSTSTAP